VPTMAPPARAVSPGMTGAAVAPEKSGKRKDSKVAAAPGFGGN
jgi:hypothetical protein